MSTNPNWERELSTFYEKKRNLFQESLVGSKWKIYPCSGSYFQILGFDAFSHEVDDEFASTLTQQHGIASIPINVFNENASRTGLLRFCFAKSDETLIAAVNKLKQIPTL
jgi:methionine aminotransferase